MKQRNTKIDFTRVVACLGVVFLHASFGLVISNPDINSSTWWIGNIVDSFTRWSTPVFVMISGALLLGEPSTTELISFYKKRFSRLLPPILFWTLVYSLFRIYIEPSFTLAMVPRDLLSGGIFYHLWYIYMLVGLCIVAPFLRHLVVILDVRSYLILMLICFAIAAIETFFGGAGSTLLTRFLPWIGYFLAGHLLFSQRPKVYLRLPFLTAGICGVSISLCTGILLPHIGARSWEIMYSYHNPLVVLMSLCVFTLLLNVSEHKLFVSIVASRLCKKLATITLGIYLIHPLWLWLFSKGGLTGTWIHPLVGIPITALLVFVCSALTSGVLACVPGLRRTVC